MTADLFLTCFVACTFAFAIVGVAAYQIVAFFLKRAIVKNLPDMLRQMSDPQAPLVMGEAAHAAMSELARNAAATPPGVTPHVSAVACGVCGRRQPVPLDQELGPFVEKIGWRFVPIGDLGWACPICIDGDPFPPVSGTKPAA